MEYVMLSPVPKNTLSIYNVRSFIDIKVNIEELNRFYLAWMQPVHTQNMRCILYHLCD